MKREDTRNKDQVLGHDFDGIEEYDNRLPNWWLFILYATIVFAFVYWIHFQTFGTGKNPVARYEAEEVRRTEAELAKMGNQDVTDATLNMMASVPARAAEGRKVFEQFCVVCHNDQGQGNVGPNLTDSYWLHGGAPLQILNTVTHGVPEKGMVAWGNQLGPNRIQAVVAYVLTLRGKNIPGKAPQGDPYEASASGTDTGAVSTPAPNPTAVPAVTTGTH